MKTHTSASTPRGPNGTVLAVGHENGPFSSSKVLLRRPPEPLCDYRRTRPLYFRLLCAVEEALPGALHGFGGRESAIAAVPPICGLLSGLGGRSSTSLERRSQLANSMWRCFADVMAPKNGGSVAGSEGSACAERYWKNVHCKCS